MTVGGSAMGVLGMLVFIPLCSVVYTLLKEAVNARLERKKTVGKNQKQEDMRRKKQ